jgi:hypothetical protein
VDSMGPPTPASGPSSAAGEEFATKHVHLNGTQSSVGFDRRPQPHAPSLRKKTTTLSQRTESGARWIPPPPLNLDLSILKSALSLRRWDRLPVVPEQGSISEESRLASGPRGRSHVLWRPNSRRCGPHLFQRRKRRVPKSRGADGCILGRPLRNRRGSRWKVCGDHEPDESSAAHSGAAPTSVTAHGDSTKANSPTSLFAGLAILGNDVPRSSRWCGSRVRRVGVIRSVSHTRLRGRGALMPTTITIAAEVTRAF